MNGMMVILSKEWRTFVGSDRGMFLLYVVLVCSWSIMLANPPGGAVQTGPLWLVFFSVVISANFSNTVFISERINGNLEILLTCGLSREHILFGKMVFVAGISILIGLLCIGLSAVLRMTMQPAAGTTIGISEVLLYCSAVIMNTALSAWLSVLMSNPRLLHLANLLILALIVTLYTVLAAYLPLPTALLSTVLILIGSAASGAALRLYNSENILKPVNL